MRIRRGVIRLQYSAKTRRVGTSVVCKGNFQAKLGARSKWTLRVALKNESENEIFRYGCIPDILQR